jgi:phosphoglycolate phosphatase-like HAD superfamily hydrolase
MLDAYRTLVFDCDGVVLDSNRIKTEAFRATALPWGAAAAEALVAHHVAHGGVSRHVKFAHFLDHILPEHAPGHAQGPERAAGQEAGRAAALEGLLAAYGRAVQAGLMACAVAEGLDALRATTPGARWLIVSGGDQAELRALFAARGLARHFDGGIFGSPDNKDTILAREQAAGTIRGPALFLGDSRYDNEAASRAGLDFVFVSDWSEFAGWPDHVRRHGLAHVRALRDLLAPAGAQAPGRPG